MDGEWISSPARLAIAVLLVFFLALHSVSAMIDTTSGGPVPVPCCPENGMPCSGGADCINGICQKEECKGPFSQCDCIVDTSGPPPGEDTSWIVVIGALIVIGAGIGAGALALGRKKRSSGKKEQKKEKVRYILQLSSDHLTVTPDAPASLTVTTWKIVGDNPPVPAPEAAITLTVPPGNGGLSVTPAAGQGSLTATLSLAAPVERSPVLLTVTAAVGKSAESAQVRVDIPQEYIMEFF